MISDGGTGGADASPNDRPDATTDRAETGTGGAGGGGGAGGANTDGGTDVGTTCPTVAFVNPIDGAMLTAADDVSGNQCAGAFMYNVTVSVAGTADGVTVELHGAMSGSTTTSPPMLATATVSGGQVMFSNVQLSQGTTILSVQIGQVPCAPTATVTVNCNKPSCAITAPAHDTLNGVMAPAGDRVSSPGSDYQAAFTVTTDIEDGQPVVLTVINGATPNAQPETVSVNAMSGAATFAGVTLKPDGQYDISATCTNRAAVVGHAAQVMFTVDTTPPTLTVDSPANGTTFAPGDLTNGAFQVCGTTTSADAVNLPVSAGAAASNLCVTRGQSTSCVPVATVNTSTCQSVACQGSATFALTVTLYDAAGNPQVQTITGLSCASTPTPAVQIVAPLTDAPNFLDVTKRLLAATAAQTLKDADGATAGAQTTVVACTDTMGGSAQLLVGHRGDATLTTLGAPVTVVAATVGDMCPTGFGYVARFTGVTLPESTESSLGTLSAATEIRVDVTNPITTTAVGTSGPTDLWVDSVVPTLTERTPSPLCGSTVQNAGTYTADVLLNSTTAMVTFTVTNGTTSMFGPPTFVAGAPTGIDTFTAVDFPQGQNTVISTATEPSGNTASLTPPIPMPTCTVTVGTAPIVTFTSPAPGQNLCANGNTLTTCIADSTPGTGASAGWQGNIAVHVTSGGVALTTGNVTFTIAGGAPQVASLDGSGNATLNNLTIADGTAVVLTATTDNVSGHGVGMASETVIVDTQPPLAPTGLMAVVTSRRQTSYTLTWTAPADADGTTAVTSYDVRDSKVAISDATFTSATAVSFAGSPKAPGQTETLLVSNLYIETAYNFGVEALDVVGNRSPSAVVAAPVAHFNQTTIAPPASAGAASAFGFTVDGSTDLDGDGRSDLLVGSYSGNSVYLYMGAASFPLPAAPTVTFTGNAASKFGFSAIVAGDVDGDGLPDIAISSSVDGIVYIYKGRATWTPGTTLGLVDANYRIVADASFTGTQFGYVLARLGDFNGDGIDDFAITAPFNNTLLGGRVVIVLGHAVGTFPATVTLPDITQTITIAGENLGDAFGAGAIGMGRFYSTGGNTLVVDARRFNAGAGKVYAFHGQAGTAGVILPTAADHTITGPAAAQYSTYLAVLGPINSVLPGLGLGNSLFTGNGNALVSFGTNATGPFANAKTFTDTGANVNGDGFGTLILGGGFSGTAVTASLVGDSKPDLLLAPATEGGTPSHLYIIDGTNYPAIAASSVDVRTVADTVYIMPAGWSQVAPRSNLIRDIDGDGYADIAVGNYSGTAGTGAVGVVW